MEHRAGCSLPDASADLTPEQFQAEIAQMDAKNAPTNVWGDGTDAKQAKFAHNTALAMCHVKAGQQAQAHTLAFVADESADTIRVFKATTGTQMNA
jgi:hypothetical protein